jgi:hypothetical protein
MVRTMFVMESRTRCAKAKVLAVQGNPTLSTMADVMSENTTPPDAEPHAMKALADPLRLLVSFILQVDAHFSNHGCTVAVDGVRTILAPNPNNMP